jgi:lysophospholipase
MDTTLKAQGLQAPDGVGLRAGVWEVPEDVAKRGLCILLQGLGEFLEKYDEVAGELNARGFTVISVDWRSQGASERGGRDNRVAHVADFDEYDHDIAVLIQRLAGAGNLPIIALAHSLGAHILLRYLHFHKRSLHCAALVAPMLDVDTQGHASWLVNFASTLMPLIGASQRPVPGTADRDPMTVRFEDNLVTSDPVRYARTQEKLRKQPFLRINGPSFGWLRAALRSMRQVRGKNYADEIVTPLVLFGAGKDRIVKTPPIREYAALLPRAEYVEIAEAEHEILMERDELRAAFWRAFDAFVENQLSENRSGFFAARGSNDG